MALFGKKKQAEQTAPQINPEEDIQMVGGDADETDIEDEHSGQVVDFDAIAHDLNAQEDGADMDSFLGKNSEQNAEPDDTFATAPNFATDNAEANIDDELDFDSTFDDSTPAPVVAASNQTGENPFGNAPDIEPVAEPVVADLTTDAPPLTHTAPILTSDAVAGGYVPPRKSPLLPLLGAAGLLVALGVVGWMVFGGTKPPETATPVVAASPPLQTSANGVIVPATANAVVPAPGAPSNVVNQGIAVDGVPIAPGVIVAQAPSGALAPPGTKAPIGMAPSPPLTPAMKKQLDALWKKGADAKHAGNIAGARAAWTQMLRLHPNHPNVQAAIDKLPAS